MLKLFELRYLRYKKKHLSNLVALAKIDGHFHETEEKLLYQIGDKYGIRPEQVKAIIKNKDKIKPEIPPHFEQKIDQFYDLVLMILADGVIDDKEMDFFKGVAQEYGFSKKVVPKIMELFKYKIPSKIEWEDFKIEAEKYYKHKSLF